MAQNKTLSLLGLAQKAGRIASGEFSTEKAVKEGRAFLVIVSEEASANTSKKFVNMCTYYRVPCWKYKERGTGSGHRKRIPGITGRTG